MTSLARRHALLLLLAVHLLRASTLFVPLFIHDEACIAVQAQTVLRGGHLYTDTADRKPPLVPYLYAAVFAVRGTADLIAVHELAILVVWLTALVLAREAGRAAAWLFVATSTSFLPIDVMAANFELFMLLPATLAMLVARRRGLLSALAAGALVALAALCKQTALVMVMPVAYRVSQKGPRSVVAMGLGMIGTLALAAAAWPGLVFWTMTGNGGYLAIDGVVEHVLPRLVGMTAAFGAATAGLWWLVARGWTTRLAHLDRWLWLLANVIAVSAGLRFFGHYYLHLLPAACAIAATAFPEMPVVTQRRIVAYTALAAVVFAMLGFWGRQLHSMPDYRPLAAEVARRTGPDDRVEIWGNYPEVLWAADRRPASRFVHSNFLTGFSSGRPIGPQTAASVTPGAWRMWLDDVEAHPPALLLDTSPSGMRDYGRYPMRDFPFLSAYVEQHYRRVATIDGVDLYERASR